MFGLKNLILVSVLVLLLVSAVLQMYVMYKMSTAQAYVVDAVAKTFTTQGVDAAQFWNSNLWFIAAPSAGSVISMALLGVLFVMG